MAPARTVNRSPWAITIMEAATLLLPLVALVLVLGIDNNVGKLWVKPEWSFISIVLLAEFLRDLGHVAKHRQESWDQIRASYSFSVLLILLTGFFLAYDYRHYEGIGNVDSGLVLLIKFAWFFVCLILFFRKRLQANSI